MLHNGLHATVNGSCDVTMQFWKFSKPNLRICTRYSRRISEIVESSIPVWSGLIWRRLLTSASVMLSNVRNCIPSPMLSLQTVGPANIQLSILELAPFPKDLKQPYRRRPYADCTAIAPLRFWTIFSCWFLLKALARNASLIFELDLQLPSIAAWVCSSPDPLQKVLHELAD